MAGNDNSEDRDVRDDDLRRRFAELRLEEEKRASEFVLPAPNWAGHGRRWSARKLVAGAVCLVAITTAVWLRLVSHRPAREPGTAVASLTEWRSPTDFLLETPGQELLRTVPAIGVWQNYTNAPGAGQKPAQKHPRVRKQVLP